tara:strand:+ start:41 stop:202 length:162 start_codon:yes stop_codon:yes gene_type:complete
MEKILLGILFVIILLLFTRETFTGFRRYGIYENDADTHLFPYYTKSMLKHFYL